MSELQITPDEREYWRRMERHKQVQEALKHLPALFDMPEPAPLPYLAENGYGQRFYTDDLRKDPPDWKTL